MTVTVTERLLRCSCGHRWKVLAEVPEQRRACPACSESVCACGCGDSLLGIRLDAAFRSEACKKRAERERSRDKAGTEHPLKDARAQQEASDLKSKLSAVIYEGIVDRLKQGPVHADDLEHLFPEGCRDLCRRLVGAQFGSLASRHYIEGTEYRKSKVPSRKGAKSWVYVFTKKGRARLAGVDTDAPSPGEGGPNRALAGVGIHSGESGAPPASRAGVGDLPASPGQPPAATTGAASPEPLKLVGDEVGRERPRSAITDPDLGAAA